MWKEGAALRASELNSTLRIQLMSPTTHAPKIKHNQHTISFLHVSESQECQYMQKGKCVDCVEFLVPA